MGSPRSERIRFHLLSPMRVGVLLHPYGERHPAGLGRYIFDLTKHLIEEGRQHHFLVYLRDEIKEQPLFSGRNWETIVLRGGRLVLEWGLRVAAPADIYIFNTPVMPLTWRPRSIVIALDFAYMRFLPRSLVMCGWKEVLRFYHSLSLRRAHHVVAISAATKEDTVSFFKVPSDKVTVIYPGFTSICATSPQQIPVPSNFFLFVGAVKERKNVVTVVRSFLEFRRRNAGYSLLIAGHAAGQYFEGIKDIVNSNGAEGEVVFLGHVSDSVLSFLYRNATALVFPSLAEGFGFPVLEAMDCGVPVITSRTSSLGEISGNAAHLVNPADEIELSTAFEILAHDASYRDILVERGSRRSAEFNWKRTAESFLSLIADVCSKQK